MIGLTILAKLTCVNYCCIFCFLRKCLGKFQYSNFTASFNEMLFTKEVRPSLNTQNDSISAKLFVQIATHFHVTFSFLMTCSFY